MNERACCHRVSLVFNQSFADCTMVYCTLLFLVFLVVYVLRTYVDVGRLDFADESQTYFASQLSNETVLLGFKNTDIPGLH